MPFIILLQYSNELRTQLVHIANGNGCLSHKKILQTKASQIQYLFCSLDFCMREMRDLTFWCYGFAFYNGIFLVIITLYVRWRWFTITKEVNALVKDENNWMWNFNGCVKCIKCILVVFCDKGRCGLLINEDLMWNFLNFHL